MFSLLHDPVSGHAASQAHYAALQRLKAWPEFSNYLAYILALCKDESAATRSKAGLQLKNNVKEQWDALTAAQHDYIKAAVIESMAADTHYLRNIVGTIIANIAVRCRIAGWPGILQHLGGLLDHPNAAIVDSAFNALSKICEDIPKELIKENDALGRPLHFLVPRFIRFFHHPTPELRVYALTAVNVFLFFMPLPMTMHLDAYMAAVFVLAKRDENKAVRRRVCQAFVILLEKSSAERPLQPHMDGVINFMLHACNDADENVALEASEFWSTYCDHAKADMKLLSKYLQPLTTTLVKGMRYSDEEIEWAEEEENAAVPDRQQDIRPTIHRGKTVRYEGTAASGSGGGGVAAQDGGGGGGEGGAGGGGGYGDKYDDDDDADDEDDEFFYDEDDDEEVSNWNLRKCSAAALDALANSFGSLLFQHLLPLLKELLTANHPPASTPASATPSSSSSSSSPSSSSSSSRTGQPEAWILRESAILALGAVAEGCFDAIQPHLHELIPYLLTFLRDKKPLVRSITCWTLSRYSKWVVLKAEGAAFFEPLLTGLLNAILDSNKKVQEAACSAFATFEEEAGLRLQPQLTRILQYLMHAFGQYQQKNMLILYDAIGTLAESVGDALKHPDCIAILMPPLMQRWNDIPDDDRAIFPLFECLTSVSTALGPAFVHYSSPVFLRCLNIISRTLQQQKVVDANNAALRQRGGSEELMDYVDAEFIVCALDLLSGLAEGLEAHLDALLTAHPQLLQLLYETMMDRDPDVRQSSFALLGDLAKVACTHLLPHLNHFLPLCATNLNPHFSSVCNNASWAVGELAIKAGAAPLAPHVDRLMNNLILILAPHPILSTVGGPAVQPKPVQGSLLENASITIGRLGLVCPQQVSGRLGEFARPWFRQLELLRDNGEKEHAYHGMCSVVEANPATVLADLPGLLRVIGQWRMVDNARMVHRLGQLLRNFKGGLEAQGVVGAKQWTDVVGGIEPALRHSLESVYGQL